MKHGPALATPTLTPASWSSPRPPWPTAWSPFNSRLHLATPLTVRAVLEHPESPWLVNLSACWTGICDLRATEQQISLPTAFLRAGAAHVLATLWTATTEMSKRFSIVFYRRLADGLRPADACHHAVKHLRDDWFNRAGEDLPAFYWAQYTHFGSPW